MKYLVDTNIISELWKQRPNDGVVRFIGEAEWFIPVPVLAEMQEGASKVTTEARRVTLNQSIDTLISDFSDAVVDWDAETSRTWGRLKHSKEVRTQPQALWDSLIDAMAIRHGYTVATRNTSDFRHANTFNPFTT